MLKIDNLLQTALQVGEALKRLSITGLLHIQGLKFYIGPCVGFRIPAVLNSLGCFAGVKEFLLFHSSY